MQRHAAWRTRALCRQAVASSGGPSEIECRWIADLLKSFNSRSSKASRISLHDVISLLLGRPRPRAVARPQALGSWRMWRRGGEDTRGDATTRRRRGVERTRTARTACRLVRVGSCHIPETCGPRSHGGGSSRSPCERSSVKGDREDPHMLTFPSRVGRPGAAAMR